MRLRRSSRGISIAWKIASATIVHGVRIHEHGLGQLARRAGEPAQDEHAVFRQPG